MRANSSGVNVWTEPVVWSWMIASGSPGKIRMAKKIKSVIPTRVGIEIKTRFRA
jgi:hypothetical protein